jgi:hypothetical protein
MAEILGLPFDIMLHGTLHGVSYALHGVAQRLHNGCTVLHSAAHQYKPVCPHSLRRTGAPRTDRLVQRNSGLAGSVDFGQ